MQDGKLAIAQIADDEDGYKMHVILFVDIQGKQVQIHVGLEEWGRLLSGDHGVDCGFEIKPNVLAVANRAEVVTA